ncbi:MAG TPA: sulfurtransferase TusA family protein [Candidatus Dormibacteraeota bacterium]|nr:sulfurtransferase TusA family protein [Candidatus Dormibacteraeota bacterium]
MRGTSSASELARLDLRGVACPLTFVRTRLALNRLAPGQPLEVLLDDGEPAESVPRSCTEDGEQVLELGPWTEPGVVRLVVARGTTPA